VNAIATLGEVVEIIMGQAPAGDTYNTNGNGLPLVAGAGDFGASAPKVKKFTSTPTKVSEPGDIIMSIRATIGTKVVGDRVYCLGRGVAGLRAKKGLDQNYLWHWLTHAEPVLASKGRGATFPQVSRSDISSLQIPILPFNEQKRIAAILDKADQLRQKRRQAIALLDSLTQSIFLEMFGDPVGNPMSWDDRFILSDVADIGSGITKGRPARGQATRSVPYLAVANVQDRSLNLKLVKQIEATEDEISRYRLLKDDLLVTEGGDPDKLGRGTLWSDELPEAIHQNHIFRIRVKDSRISPLFANWLISSERGKRYFLRSAKQTTGVASINKTQLSNFPILLPPFDLQLEFADKTRNVEDMQSKITKKILLLDTLFSSLQHRAFSGQL
jgi:type I restriction enzyme S subunit